MFALHTSAGQWYWPQNSIWYLHRLEYTILEMILLTEETDYIYINIVRNSKVCHLKIQYCFMLIEMQLMVFNWTMNKEKDSNGNENKIILAIKMTIENMLTHGWTISSFTVLQLIEANNKKILKLYIMRGIHPQPIDLPWKASIWVKSSTAPSKADPVVVFPLCWWCPPQETSQPHPPQQWPRHRFNVLKFD